MSGADIYGVASITFCQVTDLNFPQFIACLFGAGLCTGNNIIEIPAEKEVGGSSSRESLVSRFKVKIIFKVDRLQIIVVAKNINIYVS